LPNCLAAFHGFDLNKQTNPNKMLVLEKEEAPLMLVTDKGNRTSFLESVTISEPGK